MATIELLQDELIISSAAFTIIYQYSANQTENGDWGPTFHINKDRHVGHLCHFGESAVSHLGKR